MLDLHASGGRVRRSVDVLVVGAGVAGVAIARGLRARGREVLLAERSREPSRSLLGELILPGGVERARALDMGDIFDSANSASIREISFQDLGPRGESEVRSQFRATFPTTPAVAMPRVDLERGLRRSAAAALNADFLEGARVVPAEPISKGGTGPLHVVVEPDREPAWELKARWVVGCDGRHSLVRRRLAGARDTTKLPPRDELFVGMDVPSSSRPEHCYNVIRTHGQGTLLAFSLGAGRQRIYWNARTQREVALARGLEGPFARALAAAAGTVGNLEGARLSAAPIGACWFGPPGGGTVLLAGDAACVTSPLAGHGMTLALENAAWILDAVDWDDTSPRGLAQVQQRYAAQVRHAFERVGVIVRFLHPLFFSRRRWWKPMTAHVMKTWCSEPDVAQMVVRRFAGLDRTKTRLHEAARIAGLRKLRGLREPLAMHPRGAALGPGEPMTSTEQGEC